MQARQGWGSGALVVAVLLVTAADSWAITRYVNPGGDIQGAINSSAAGDTVHLNAGTFNISSPIVAKTGVAIEGAGRLNTTVVKTGGGTIIDLNARSNVQIADLTLHGSDTALYGIDGSNGSGHYIHDSGITSLGANANGIRFSGAGGTYTSGVTDSRIVNNQFSNIGVGSVWGAGVRMAWGSSRNQVIGNTIANAGRGGIFGNDGSTDLVIRNNTVTGSGSGGTGLGIEIWRNCHRSVIENNNVDQWLSVDSSDQVAVRNNTVTGGFIGLEMGTAGSDNIFSGNTVTGAATGISMSNAGTKQRMLFANNTISSSTQWGAQIAGGDGNPTIEKLYFYKNTIQGTGGTFPSAGTGLRFNCDYVTAIQNITLDRNTLRNNNGFGFVLGTWPGHNKFRNLRVVNNTIGNNHELAVSGSFGALDWLLQQTGSFAGAAAADNNRNPVNELSWSGNTLTNNGTGYTSSPPWPSDRQNANNHWTSTGTFLAPGNMPSVSINAPSQAIVGEPVQFSLTYTPGASPLGNVLWDLGDGLPAMTSSTSFTYLNPGVYDVGLVVWDTGGRGVLATGSVSVVTSPEDLDWGVSTGVFFPVPAQGVLPELNDEALAQLYLAPDGNIDATIAAGGATTGDDIVLDSVVLRNDGNSQEDFAVFQRLFQGTYGTGTLYGVLFSSATAGAGDRYYRGPGVPTSSSPTSYDLNADLVHGNSWNGTILPGGSTVFISWRASAGFIDALGNPILPNVGDRTLAQLVYSPDGVADNLLPGGIFDNNDVVLDARIITNNGGLWEDYGLFGSQEYRGPFQSGFIYGVMYEDADPSTNDRYYAGPMEAITAGVFYEFNVDFVNGDEWNGTISGVNIDALWGASGGFVDDTGDRILPGPGDETLAQLMFSPDGIEDAMLAGGIPANDDIVLDTGTVQNIGGPLAQYGVFGPLSFTGDYQAGLVYGVIFADDTPGAGDRYYAGPLQATVANAGPTPDTYEMNRNLVDGDAWNRTVSSGVAAQYNWAASAGFIDDIGNPILPTIGNHTVAYLVYTPDNAADPMLPGGVPGGNDVVLDRRIVTNNGGLWEDYGLFSAKTYHGVYLPGYIYGVIFEDDNPQAGDRYYTAPLDPTAGFVPHEMNVDFVNGDMWNGSVIAQGLALDFDNDGMSNDFELRHFGDYTAGLPWIDSDFDGILNLGEYIAGTDAMNSNSFLGVTSFLWEPAQVTLTLRDTSVRRRYRCEFADSISPPGAWTPLGAAVPGTGGDAAIVEGEGPAVPARVYRGTALLP